MFSSVESCRTKRANKRLVASSIMAIRYNFSPRPSSQSCSLVSHCTSSPNRLRRGRQTCTCLTRAFFPCHNLARIIHSRTVSLLTAMPCFLRKYSQAKVGPNPWYTGADKISTASCSVLAAIFRFEPRTGKFEVYISYGFANPHGHVFDRWGQNFVTDGTGNVNYFAAGFSGRVEFPSKHKGYKPYFKQRTRPCAGTEILSSKHFPDECQGNLLIANVIGFQGIHQYRYEDEGSGFTAVATTASISSSLGQMSLRRISLPLASMPSTSRSMSKRMVPAMA